MSSQDIITYKQKVVKILHNEDVLKTFQDDNLMLVLKFLRKKPMTIQELENSFKRVGIEKSDKTIYRYLSKLIQQKLAAKGGKRVTSKDEDILVNETVYIRTAKAFLFAPSLIQKKERINETGEEHCTIYDITRLLIGQLFDNTEGSESEFNILLDDINEERNILTTKLFDNASKLILEKMDTLEWADLNAVFNFAGWIAVCAKNNLQERIKKCYL